MILWVPLSQERTVELMAERNITALISPIHRGHVTALLPSVVFPTHLNFGEDFAGINTQVDSTGGRIVVAMVGQRGRARALLRWNLPDSHGEPAVRVSSDDDVAKMATELARLFGPDALHGPNGDVEGGIEALRAALKKTHHGQAGIVDALAAVIDLPELRERVDKRIAVGPNGPSIDYPARLVGPTEVVQFTGRTLAARSRSDDPLDRVLFAPRWSGTVDPRFAVIEVACTGSERLLKIFQRDAPVAAAVWNERWRLTPAAPPEVADVFLEELNRVLPWQWDRRAMRDLLAERTHPDPLGEFGRITSVPTLEPLFQAEDWTAISPTARIVPRATDLRLAFYKARAGLGQRLARGSWAPIDVTNQDIPNPGEGMQRP
ncbi:MAG: hypothetical protein LBJ08_12905 [Bifidobacteriaceae bacterium]|nr:hypothetical protein [Bifidobacteriaceae bacterium]